MEQSILFFLGGSYAFQFLLQKKGKINDYDTYILKDDFEQYIKKYPNQEIRKIFDGKYKISNFLSKDLEINVIDTDSMFYNILKDLKATNNNKKILLEGKINAQVLDKEFLYLEKTIHITKRSKRKWKKDLLLLLKDTSFSKRKLLNEYKEQIKKEKDLTLRKQCLYFLEYKHKDIIDEYLLNIKDYPQDIKNKVSSTKIIKDKVMTALLEEDKKTIIILYYNNKEYREFIIDILTNYFKLF